MSRTLTVGAMVAAIAVVAPTGAIAMKYLPGSAAPVPYQVPATGTEEHAEVGKPLAAAGRVMPAIEVTQGARAKAKSGDTIEIPTGIYRLTARSERGSYYKPQDTTISLYSFWVSSPYDDGGIHIPDDANAPPEAYFRAPTGGIVHKSAPDIRQRPISPIGLTGGFRRELIYGGVAKGVVSLSYREFVNDMARPAFTQQLTYDLADGNEIGFRGARIRVLEANNVGIRYVVLQPLSAVE